MNKLLAIIHSFIQNNLLLLRDILIISTMDGMITALDTGDDGKVLWQLQTGPGSLLSSSISKVELNSEGKLIRLIPSLNGALYKFDGEGVEPIQMSADSLLHTSYLAADDLLITGESLHKFGLNFCLDHDFNYILNRWQRNSDLWSRCNYRPPAIHLCIKWVPY